MPETIPIDYRPEVGDPVLIIHEGKVIRRSRNLQGLISHAHRAGVRSAAIHSSSPLSGGMAYVNFHDGSWTRVQFASFTVCRDFFKARWKKWGLYAEIRNSDTYWSFI